MYLISAYFDEETGRRIGRYINMIAEKSGNRFMTDNHVPPHLTVSALEARAPEQLFPVLSKLEEKFFSGELQFVSVGMFFPYVIYLAPVLNEYLHRLSVLIYDEADGLSEVIVNKYYRPLQWLPHVTLGKKLTKEEMRIAFGIMQEQFAPFTGKVASVGLARTNPHEDIRLVKL